MMTLSRVSSTLQSAKERMGQRGLLAAAVALGALLAVVSWRAGVLDFAGFVQFDTLLSSTSGAFSAATV